MRLTSKIYVAGHRGMVGSAVVRRLQARGFDNLCTRTHSEVDLENQSEARNLFAAEAPEHVFLAAARVGGIHANYACPVDFLLRTSRSRQTRSKRLIDPA